MIIMANHFNAKAQSRRVAKKKGMISFFGIAFPGAGPLRVSQPSQITNQTLSCLL
ncbi:MAG: hypothetical protein JWR26_1156 [Pedosphaera sp.]|nr:hypothetical protein [Pedosphaera sp.]